MIVEQPKFTCELCGGVHPTSEHKKPKEGESQQELPESDYVEDNPEAIAKGKELFRRAQELEKAEKFKEALAALTEDKFAVAAYLAARAQENSKGLIWVPIKIDTIIKKYKSDPKIVPRKSRKYGGQILSIYQGGGSWVGLQTPFAPWVQKMYTKDRPIHAGKEMASFTGPERLHEYLDDLKAKLRQLKEDQRLR